MDENFSVTVFRALEGLYLVWVVVKQLGRIFGDVWISVWRTGGPGMDIAGLESGKDWGLGLEALMGYLAAASCLEFSGWRWSHLVNRTDISDGSNGGQVSGAVSFSGKVALLRFLMMILSWCVSLVSDSDFYSRICMSTVGDGQITLSDGIFGEGEALVSCMDFWRVYWYGFTGLRLRGSVGIWQVWPICRGWKDIASGVCN